MTVLLLDKTDFEKKITGVREGHCIHTKTYIWFFNFFSNSQKLEITKCPVIGEWLKQTLVHLYHGTPLNKQLFIHTII